MDLREEIQRMIDDYGYYVLLQRTSRKARCTHCWNDRNQEADSRCVECGGTGWKVRLERHKACQRNASQTTSRPGQTYGTELGDLATPAHYFYFEHDVQPQVGDFIYIVGWRDKARTRPADLVAVQRINFAESHRGSGGRIEYCSAATRAITLDKPARSIIMRTLAANRTIYELRY